MTNDIISKRKLRVAVTSQNGRLVDMHFGKADAFLIYEVDPEGSRCLERRAAEGAVCEEKALPRAAQRVERIADCDAVLTMRMGSHAQEQLASRGILGVEYDFTIEKGLCYVLRVWQALRASTPEL